MKNETARREIESLDYYLQNHTDDYSEESHTAMMMGIKALEQEPKTGTWEEDIDNSRRWDKVRFYCSECGKWQTYGKTDYCPSCGAKMVEPQESEGK